MTNASITLLRAPAATDDTTGYRKEKADEDVERLIADARCVFVASRASRQPYKGLREMVKTLPVVLLDHVPNLDVAVGDRALVTQDGFGEKTYRVGHAFMVPSIAQQQWYIELEGVDTPSA